MKGHIQRRGKNSFRLKFDAGRDEKTGERKTQFHTFRGTKRQAQIKLAELITAVDKSKYVETHTITAANIYHSTRPHCHPPRAHTARPPPTNRQRYKQHLA